MWDGAAWGQSSFADHQSIITGLTRLTSQQHPAPESAAKALQRLVGYLVGAFTASLLTWWLMSGVVQPVSAVGCNGLGLRHGWVMT